MPIPKLIKDLNIFLDHQGVLRSKGRIQNCTMASYGVVNPVLLHENGVACPKSTWICLKPALRPHFALKEP